MTKSQFKKLKFYVWYPARFQYLGRSVTQQIMVTDGSRPIGKVVLTGGRVKAGKSLHVSYKAVDLV